MRTKILQIMFAALVGMAAQAQINTGSNGSDGALDFGAITMTTNIVINMADHPTGIYQYTYVNIPTNVTMSFIPNANNTPVYWLVQNGAVINGTVNVSGQNNTQILTQGGFGGPGGYKGGDSANGTMPPSSGQGPGGGLAGADNGNGLPGNYNYGNIFLLPLLGGSGGGGGVAVYDTGGGGGGAILIAASSVISINGGIHADGSTAGRDFYHSGGGGSGGAIRLVASQITGNGTVSANGSSGGGAGRIRFDTFDNEFSGGVGGQITLGFQPIIIPTVGQLPQLTVTSVGGVAVSPSPTGQLSTPDAVLSAQQNNPIPVVVSCANLPLGSLITVTVTPMTGSPVSATGYNNTGTLLSSTATISISIPRGGGLICATATTSP